MKLISLLSGKGFVMYNKELARSVSVNASIIFGQLCSSYESFRNKKMLTVRDGKEYFFLTSETLEEETSLSYKLQLKAAKELEQNGFIETKTMGVPSKKYFHITNKIIQELLSEGSPSSSQKEDLNAPTIQEDKVRDSNDFRYSQRERLGMTNGNSKECSLGSAIKKKNKKEQYKDKNIKPCNYKEQVPKEIPNDNKSISFESKLLKATDKFYTQFACSRYSKKQWNTLIEKFIYDTLARYDNEKIPDYKIDGFVFKCLKKISSNTDYKYSSEYKDYLCSLEDLVSNVSNSNPCLSKVFYNWLE